MVDVLMEIAAERRRQDAKWGTQNHGAFEWATILGEEFGEACEAALNSSRALEPPEELKNALITKLTHVAAVAVAWIEAIR